MSNLSYTMEQLTDKQGADLLPASEKARAVLCNIETAIILLPVEERRPFVNGLLKGLMAITFTNLKDK